MRRQRPLCSHPLLSAASYRFSLLCDPHLGLVGNGTSARPVRTGQTPRLVRHVRPPVHPASLRARRGLGGGARELLRLRCGRSPGAAAAAAAVATTAAATAAAVFGCRIWNPCVSLTMKQSSNVPAFLSKLWTLVEETHTNEFITWSQVRRPPNPLTNRLLSPSCGVVCRGLRLDAFCEARGGGVARAPALSLARDPCIVRAGSRGGPGQRCWLRPRWGEGQPAPGAAAREAP